MGHRRPSHDQLRGQDRRFSGAVSCGQVRQDVTGSSDSELLKGLADGGQIEHVSHFVTVEADHGDVGSGADPCFPHGANRTEGHLV